MSGLSSSGQSVAQPATFADALRSASYHIDVDPVTSTISGAGASVLAQAIDGATYVFAGEEHGTREIPEWTAALCRAMAQRGLAGYVTEASPRAAALTQRLLRSPERRSEIHKHLQQYPYSMAFLNMREESDLAARCAMFSDERFTVMGVDQEFIGSTLWLIDSVLATHPGPNATAALKHLRGKLEASAAAARASDDPNRLLIEALNESDIETVTALLRKEGSAEAQAIVADVVESHSIYMKNLRGQPESNAQRALLLKRNLLDAITRTERTHAGEHPRLLIKLGGYHGYKGFNPLHQRDLGNMLAEFADMRGERSLHIMVQGVRGSERMLGSYGKPSAVHPFALPEETEAAWFKAFLPPGTEGAATLIDLRRLRFGEARPQGYEQQQLVDGYDLLLLVPVVHPSTLMDEMP